MIFDLHHNKIISNTITEKFEQSVKEALLPLLSEKYDGFLGIQMYEDYISDDFKADGAWFYPFTVITEKEIETQWVSWPCGRDFEGGVPYAYVGNGTVEFTLVDEPREFAARLVGRSRFCESGVVKIKVDAAAPSPTFLSGKYSQTFVDEMARQLTPAICKAMSVEGLADSEVELVLVFAPETYMEHTSENVTYRRLLMTDGAGAPRDFWIKWTRLDGATAYTVSNHVSAEVITFEIGEEVSQKIREKEYRNLIRLGKDKYHDAMGRRNVTEWREVIKRAIRRGSLTRVEKIPAPVIENDELVARLTEILGTTAPVAEPVAEVADSDDGEFALAMRKLAAETAEDSLDETVGETLDEALEDSLDENDEEAMDELESFYTPEADLEVDEGAVASNDEEAEELDEITRMAMEALRLASARPAEVSFDEPNCDTVEEEPEDEVAEEDEPRAEEVASVESGEAVCEETEPAVDYNDPTADEYESEEDAEALAEVRALEPDGDTEDEAAAPKPTAEELEAKIREELEAKIRLEYESLARKKAEEEAARLRAVEEQLRLENERLQAEFEKERLARARRDEERRAEEDKLRAQLEMQLRAEQRERDRLADAARIAVEEQRRLEEERLRIEKARAEEAERIAEERRRAEEAERLEAERAAEAERIRREAEGKPAVEPPAQPVYDNKNYTFVSKNVRLVFRRSVDPNITARIYEIIKATIEYYGKEKVYLKIKASIPDTTTVCLEFVKIPMEEMELLSNIIKVLGNSGLGIAKAIVE